MYVRKSPERDRPSSSGSSETSPSHRSVRFSLLPSLTSVNSAISSAGKIVRERKESINETYDQLRMKSVRLKEPVTKKSFKVSVWILSALVLLLASNVLYMVAFLSEGWGWVDMPDSEGQEKDWWDFGLWQCCRHSDGVCRGPRWPGFFSAARAFAVLGLFGNVFTFAWMLGYTLEKLMDYDPSTVASLITLSFTSAVFMVISVCCFGLFWPNDFANEYHGHKAHLSWAYAFAVASAVLLIGAGILGIFEMKSIIMRLAAKQYPAMKRHRKKDLNQALNEDEQLELKPFTKRVPQKADSWPSDGEAGEDEVFGERDTQQDETLKDDVFTDIILKQIAEDENEAEDENNDSRASRRTVTFQEHKSNT